MRVHVPLILRRHHWVALALLVVPVALYLVLAAKVSWHPRVLVRRIQANQLLFLGQGAWLVVDGRLGSGSVNALQVWDVGSGRLRHEFSSAQGSFLWHVMSGDGTTMVEAISDKSLRLWDVPTGQYRGELISPMAATDTDGMVLSPDGSLLVVMYASRGCASSDGDSSCAANLVLWDTRLKTVRRKLMESRFTHAFWLRELAFSPDSAWIAATDWRDCYVWDTHSGRLLWHKQHAFAESFSGLIFSPDSQTLVGMDANHLNAWDVRTGRLVDHVTGFLKPEWSADGNAQLIFTANGRVLVILDKSGSMHSLSRLGAGHKMRSLGGPSYEHFVLAPDSDTVALAHDNVVALYSLASGARERRISCRTGAVTALAFTPDGNALVTAGDDGTVKLWRIH